MYTSLARLYDRLMDDVDYPAWARHYEQLIARAGGSMDSVFECACGTGALTAELAARGGRIAAADLSEDMLAEAAARMRRRGLRVPLARQDMRRVETPRRVHAVIACCDGANYLLSDDDLLAFFTSAGEALRPGGVLAFDVSSREKLTAMDGQTFCDERDDAACIWRCRWNEASARLTMDVSLYLRGEGGLYRRTEERHVQAGRTAPGIVRLLERAGFADIRAYGDMTFEAPLPGCRRIHFTAVRPHRDQEETQP